LRHPPEECDGRDDRCDEHAERKKLRAPRDAEVMGEPSGVGEQIVPIMSLPFLGWRPGKLRE